MGKQAAAGLGETPVRTSKGEIALEKVVTEKIEPETVKKSKKSKHQKAEVEEALEDKNQETLKKEKNQKKKEQAEAAAEEVQVGTPKKEKKRKSKEACSKGEAEAMLRAKALKALDEAKMKRKEEKRKRQQVAEEVTAAAKEQGKEEAPKKKRHIESGAGIDVEIAQMHGASSAASPVDELTVRVGGLSLTCTEEALHKEFSKCGEIASLKVPGKKKSRGIAFITYTSTEDVEKALKLNASDYEGCTLRVKLSEREANEKSNQAEANHDSTSSSAFQVFVGNLPVQAAEPPLRKHFRKCGKIATFLMPQSARNCPKGLAYITYKTQKGFKKALSCHGTDFDGRTLEVEKVDVDHKSAAQVVKEKSGSALKVFVGGLPLEADEAALRKTFGKCGEISSLKSIVPSNPETKRGIVFVTYKAQEGFDKALLLDGTDYEGCTLRVKHAGDGRARDKESTPTGTGKDRGAGKGKGKDGKGKTKGKGKGKDKGKKGKSSGKQEK